MKDGATSKVVVINKGHIKAAMEASKGSDKPYSPWQKHTEAMWLKTAAHRLAKWVPTSAEYIREQLRAVRDVSAEPVGTTTLPTPASDAPPAPSYVEDRPAGVDENGVVDAEVVIEDPPAGWDDVDVRRPADAPA